MKWLEDMDGNDKAFITCIACMIGIPAIGLIFWCSMGCPMPRDQQAEARKAELELETWKLKAKIAGVSGESK